MSVVRNRRQLGLSVVVFVEAEKTTDKFGFRRRANADIKAAAIAERGDAAERGEGGTAGGYRGEEFRVAARPHQFHNEPFWRGG